MVKDGVIPRIDEEYDYSDSSFSVILEEELTATQQDESNMLDATSSMNNSSCEVRDLSMNESKKVTLWRNVVTGILILFACFLAVGSYLYLSHEETKDFESAFQQYTETIEQSAQEMEAELQKTLSTLADQITSYTLDSGSVLPLVTMPFFQRYANKARESSLVQYVSLCPLVAEAEQVDWETYASENQWWLSGDPEQPVANDGNQSVVLGDTNESIPNHIFRLASDNSKNQTNDIGKGPYAPRWQSTVPIDHGYVNFDVISPPAFHSLFMAMMATRSPVISEVIEANRTDMYLPYHFTSSESSTTTLDSASTKSIIFHPVTHSFHEDSSIVGLVEVLLDWKQLLARLLPEGSSGIFYVLQSS